MRISMGKEWNSKCALSAAPRPRARPAVQVGERRASETDSETTESCDTIVPGARWCEFRRPQLVWLISLMASAFDYFTTMVMRYVTTIRSRLAVAFG